MIDRFTDPDDRPHPTPPSTGPWLILATVAALAVILAVAALTA